MKATLTARLVLQTRPKHVERVLRAGDILAEARLVSTVSKRPPPTALSHRHAYNSLATLERIWAPACVADALWDTVTWFRCLTTTLELGVPLREGDAWLVEGWTAAVAHGFQPLHSASWTLRCEEAACPSSTTC